MTIPALGVLNLPDFHTGQPTSLHREAATSVDSRGPGYGTAPRVREDTTDEP